MKKYFLVVSFIAAIILAGCSTSTEDSSSPDSEKTATTNTGGTSSGENGTGGTGESPAPAPAPTVKYTITFDSNAEGTTGSTASIHDDADVYTVELNIPLL